MQDCFSFALFIMKLLCLALLIVGANCFYVNNSGLEEEKIIGGNYASITQAPYQAQVLQNQATFCGAVIISEYWLLSAAHCFRRTFGLSVRTGSSYLSSGESHEIEKIILNDNYDISIADNDISLIKLTQPINFHERQKPIRLARKAPKEGDKMIISGYGSEKKGKPFSDVLKLATVPVVNHLTCVRKYTAFSITDNMFCAGIGPTDACQGDSGGPGVINGELAGLVSLGDECGSTYYPGVYMRIDKYISWIAKSTGLNII